jgi:CubicO group peptidase (beta-lactamase class C family)
MTPDLVTNIASVSKTLTAVAVLQLLGKAGETPDTEISSYIYSDWKSGAGAAILVATASL